MWITKLLKEFLAPFHPDTDYLEKTGCECTAIGEQLEHIFGY
jgi:hypothetical protein